MKPKIKRRKPSANRGSLKHYPTLGSIPEKHFASATPTNIKQLYAHGVTVPDIAAIFKKKPHEIQKIVGARTRKKVA